MAIIQVSYKIDLIQLQNGIDVGHVLYAHRNDAVNRLGYLIAKEFPFKKDELLSFKGVLPAACLNRDHEFVDVYTIKLNVEPL